MSYNLTNVLAKRPTKEVYRDGENTIKLSGVPEICVDLDTKELFLIETISTSKDVNLRTKYFLG